MKKLWNNFKSMFAVIGIITGAIFTTILFNFKKKFNFDIKKLKPKIKAINKKEIDNVKVIKDMDFDTKLDNAKRILSDRQRKRNK